MKELIEKLRYNPRIHDLEAAGTIERLELEAVAWGVTVGNLQAELDALKQQEPIGWVFPDEDYSGSVIKPYADAPSLLPVFLAAGAQPVPEGYQLVPTEPTTEMVDSADRGWNDFSIKTFGDIYKAMLEAAKVKP